MQQLVKSSISENIKPENYRFYKIKSGNQSRLERLYRYAENIRNQDNFEDDFTILEVAFN